MREASIPCPLLSHGYYQSKWRWTKIQKKNCGSSRRTGDEWKRKMVRARARSRSHNRNNDNSLNFLFFLFILLAFLLIKCEEFNWFEVVEFYELADCCWERETRIGMFCKCKEIHFQFIPHSPEIRNEQTHTHIAHHIDIFPILNYSHGCPQMPVNWMDKRTPSLHGTH